MEFRIWLVFSSACHCHVSGHQLRSGVYVVHQEISFVNFNRNLYIPVSCSTSWLCTSSRLSRTGRLSPTTGGLPTSAATCRSSSLRLPPCRLPTPSPALPPVPGVPPSTRSLHYLRRHPSSASRPYWKGQGVWSIESVVVWDWRYAEFSLYLTLGL